MPKLQLVSSVFCGSSHLRTFCIVICGGHLGFFIMIKIPLLHTGLFAAKCLPVYKPVRTKNINNLLLDWPMPAILFSGLGLKSNQFSFLEGGTLKGAHFGTNVPQVGFIL